MKPHPKRLIAMLATTAFLALLWASGATAQGKAAAGGLFVEERGRYRIVVEGQTVGTEEFQISRAGSDWVARGTTEIPSAGGTSKLTGRLRFTPQGAPLQYEYDWSPQSGKKVAATVVFQDGAVKMDTQMEGAQAFTQEFKFDQPVVVVLDNNLYHHYAILARLYDWEKKGAQTFPVLIPQDQTPGTISIEWVGAHAEAGTKLDALRVRSADLELEVYVDPARRVVKLAVPAAKAEVTREP